jgi:PTH1 family peptidyl-tRNA hydrolase
MKYLIVGLGNPGPKYEDTRHNAGFQVLNHLLKGKDEDPWAAQRYGEVSEYRFKGRRAVLLKPNTFMNLCGKAVRYWMNEENIPIENILIISDDLAIPFGILRLRAKGSDGGHNGLKDINAVLGTNDYARLRFGIGDAFSRGKQVDYVLGEWEKEELQEMDSQLDFAVQIIKGFMAMGVQRTMNDFNKRKRE